MLRERVMAAGSDGFDQPLGREPLRTFLFPITRGVARCGSGVAPAFRTTWPERLAPVRGRVYIPTRIGV